MIQSHIVEIDGIFLGAAVRQPEGYRFVAVDARLDLLHGRVWPTLADVRRHARSTFFSGRAPGLLPATIGRPEQAALR